MRFLEVLDGLGLALEGSCELAGEPERKIGSVRERLARSWAPVEGSSGPREGVRGPARVPGVPGGSQGVPRGVPV